MYKAAYISRWKQCVRRGQILEDVRGGRHAVVAIVKGKKDIFFLTYLPGTHKRATQQLRYELKGVVDLQSEESINENEEAFIL